MKGYEILEKNNLQTAQESTKTYIELIASYVQPKTNNRLRSHLRAIMALHHHRLIRPRKKIRPNFLCSTSWLCKILPTNLGTCNCLNQPFIPFIHHTWGETVLWRTVFIIQTSDRRQYFTILQYKLHLFNIQDDGSTRGLLAKPLKKFPKSPIHHPVLTFVVRTVASVWMNINRVTLQHNKEFIMFTFYLMV